MNVDVVSNNYGYIYLCTYIFIACVLATAMQEACFSDLLRSTLKLLNNMIKSVACVDVSQVWIFLQQLITGNTCKDMGACSHT